MADCFITRRGTGLNFNIIACASENELPSSARANTFAIITSTAINGYSFSPTAPTVPKAGMVWIATDTDSDFAFNALGMNEIMVYPNAVKQYVGGSWVDVDTFVFRNGAWIAFNAALYIFKSGEGALVELTTDKESNSSITVGTNNITTNYTNSDGYYTVIARTKNKIDLSPYSTLYMKCTPSDVLDNEFSYFGVASSFSMSSDVSALKPKTAITESSKAKTIAVDISSVTTSMYVAFMFAGKMTVTDIWLER